MLVETERLRSELAAACGHAGLEPGTFVVWLVAAIRPPGTTPVAYLHPDGEVRPGTVAVFRAVGAKRVSAHRAHRLALWSRLPGFPEAALGPMLRHELEHARRWEASGSAFFDADDRLRRAVGPAGYASLPSELEANAAAGEYAAASLTAAELAELRATPECANLFATGPVPGDVAAATFSALGMAAPATLGPARLNANGDAPLVEPLSPVWPPATAG